MAAITKERTAALPGCLACYGFALLLCKLLDPFLGSCTLYMTLFPTIVFLAVCVGLSPSVIPVLLGFCRTTDCFAEPRGIPRINPTDTMRFLVAATCIIAAGEISRRSQMRLRRAQALFETLLDSGPGAKFLKDQNGRDVYLNGTAGLFTLDPIGKTDFELFPAPYASQWRENDPTCIGTELGR